MDGGVRSTESIITFDHPFLLTALGVAQPAGSYRLVVDEAEIEGLSFMAYRRIATMLHLPAIEASASTRQVYLVNPDELEAALAADRVFESEPAKIERAS